MYIFSLQAVFLVPVNNINSDWFIQGMVVQGMVD